MSKVAHQTGAFLCKMSCEVTSSKILHLHKWDVRTSQGFQYLASIMIVVPTIRLGEERQCDPDLSFLFKCKQHDSDDGGQTTDQVHITLPPTFQPLSQSRPPCLHDFSCQLVLKCCSIVDHLIVNVNVFLFDT